MMNEAGLSLEELEELKPLRDLAVGANIQESCTTKHDYIVQVPESGIGQAFRFFRTSDKFERELTSRTNQFDGLVCWFSRIE